jgi:tetratricopeptide (TPR) repeat protein
MPEKNKATIAKGAERRLAQHRAANGSEPSDPAEAARSGAAVAAVAVAQHSQLACFEDAMRLFHAQRFGEARKRFAQAREGPQRDVAQRAGLHMKMCDGRLQEAAAPQSAEEHYDYGVALLNTRQMEAALDHLTQALAMAPDAGHIHYAMALACALSDNLQLAHEHLRRSIEIDPANRIAARQDADFVPYVKRQPLESLVFPERRGW